MGKAPEGLAPAEVEKVILEMQTLMWNKAGIVRTGQGLKEASGHLEAMASRLPEPVSRRSAEARNIHTAAQLIVRSAQARLESRGAHYRTDFPSHDDAKFRKHSVISAANGIRFE